MLCRDPSRTSCVDLAVASSLWGSGIHKCSRVEVGRSGLDPACVSNVLVLLFSAGKGGEKEEVASRGDGGEETGRRLPQERGERHRLAEEYPSQSLKGSQQRP